MIMGSACHLVLGSILHSSGSPRVSTHVQSSPKISSPHKLSDLSVYSTHALTGVSRSKLSILAFQESRSSSTRSQKLSWILIPAAHATTRVSVFVLLINFFCFNYPN